MLNAQLLQRIRLQVLLHDVHFRHGVHNRRCRSEYHTAAAVKLLQVTYLSVKVKGSLCAFCLAQAGNIAHSGGIFEILKVVCLVNKQAVHTQILEHGTVLVLGLVGQLFQLGFQLLTFCLQLLYGKALTALGFFFRIEGEHDAVNLFLIELLTPGGSHLDLLELGVGENYCIIVIVLDSVDGGHSLSSCHVLVTNNQDICSREIISEFLAPLSNNIVRHHEHRLFDNAQLLELHSRSSHFHGLTGTHSVCKQGITTGVDDTGNRILLVISQGIRRIQAVHRKAGTTVLGSHQGIVGLIVKLLHFTAAAFILPQPLSEFFIQFLYLFGNSFGLCLVQDTGTVTVIPVNIGSSAVEHILKDGGECLATLAPDLCILSAHLSIGIIDGHFVLIGLRNVLNRKVLFAGSIGSVVVSFQNVANKVLIHTYRHPVCTRVYIHIGMGHCRRYHFSERFHIVLVVLVNAGQALHLTQLRSDITAEVLCCRNQIAVLILKDKALVNQLSGNAIGLLSGESCNHGHIHAAHGVQADGQTFFHIFCAGCCSVCSNGILCEDIRLFSDDLLAFGSVIFQAEYGVPICKSVDGLLILGRIQIAILFHKGIICLVQRFS